MDINPNRPQPEPLHHERFVKTRKIERLPDWEYKFNPSLRFNPNDNTELCSWSINFDYDDMTYEVRINLDAWPQGTINVIAWQDGEQFSLDHPRFGPSRLQRINERIELCLARFRQLQTLFAI